MKNFKRIITLMLTLVMMMAMSVTAFATEGQPAVPTQADATITVTGLSTREATTVSIIKLVSLDEESNTFKAESWTGMSDETDLSKIENYKLDDLVSKAGNQEVLKKTTNVSGESFVDTVVFTGIEPGSYLIIATGAKVKYNTMIAKTYDYVNGVYSVASAEVIAKNSSITVDKTTDEANEFVYAGEVIPFTITGTVPFDKEEYKIFDKYTNLAVDVESVVITVGGESTTDVAITNNEETNTITFDFKNFLAGNANAGKTISITYNAKVLGNQGYINTLWDSENGSESAPLVTVTGFTGKITFLKTDVSEDNKLAGGEFKVYTEDGDTKKYATFEANEAGVLVFAGYVDSEDKATTLVTDADGQIVITGLEDVTYYFHETKAPKGYALNPDDTVVTVSAKADLLEKDTENKTTLVYAFKGNMKDSQLAQLPFTGGTGTYVFTILGVLIMVVAAVLYFRAKKK